MLYLAKARHSIYVVIWNIMSIWDATVKPVIYVKTKLSYNTEHVLKTDLYTYIPLHTELPKILSHMK
jgi:hypothetical protein